MFLSLRKSYFEKFQCYFCFILIHRLISKFFLVYSFLDKNKKHKKSLEFFLYNKEYRSFHCIRSYICNRWRYRVLAWAWRSCYSLLHSGILSKCIGRSNRSRSFIWTSIFSRTWWSLSFLITPFTGSNFSTLRPWFYCIFIRLIGSWTWKILFYIFLSTHS